MEDILDISMDIVADATIDTLKLVPFLLVVYLLMEWIEHRAGDKAKSAVQKAGAAGPLMGALLGALPQCGFSAAGATLYAGRVVTLGTLFAVFLSTSDELIPIMVAEQAPLSQMAAILASKMVIGLIMGFAVDAVLHLRQKSTEKLAIHELCEFDHCHCSGGCATCEMDPERTYEHDKVLATCESEHAHDRDDNHDCSHEHEHAHNHEHEHTHTTILKSACVHTLQVSLFIWAVSLLLAAAFELVGEEAIASALGANPVLAIFAASLVGLIPNCAASVALVELYLEGVIATSAMMAGLLVSAGVGILVLCRTNHHVRENVLIIGALYAMGVVWGLAFLLTGISF